MPKTIWYAPIDGECEEVVMIDLISHLSKAGDDTIIHLTTGVQLMTHDSIRKLDARINTEE